MFKNEEGITLAMLSLTVAILLIIVFATILLVFDSGIFPDNTTEGIAQNTNTEIVNNGGPETQQINRTEAVNNTY